MGGKCFRVFESFATYLPVLNWPLFRIREHRFIKFNGWFIAILIGVGMPGGRQILMVAFFVTYRATPGFFPAEFNEETYVGFQTPTR